MTYYDLYANGLPISRPIRYCSECYYVSKLKKRKGVLYDGTCTCEYSTKYLIKNPMGEREETRCSVINRENSCNYYTKAIVYQFAIRGKVIPLKSKWIGRILQTRRMKQSKIEWERRRALEEIS